MSHLPVDHPLRGLYRGLALLTGVLLVVFGVVGYVQTSDLPFFDQTGERVLGLTTNPAFAILSLLTGVIVTIAALIGRNVDVPVYHAVGWLFVVAGLVMLCVIRTDVNLLASSITNANVSFIVGLMLVTAGLYGTVSRQRSKAKVSRERSEAKV
jgi:Domain of unknown function (DUF4383)